MGKALYAGATGPLVHTGAGKVVAVLVSTSGAESATIVLYDDTKDGPNTELLTILLNPAQSPTFVSFPAALPVPFLTGLYVKVPSAATVCHVWAIGF